MARWCALLASAVVILTADASAFAQTALYACSSDTATAERVGVTLCNAGPTDALTSSHEWFGDHRRAEEVPQLGRPILHDPNR